jgi:hypothetical protein
MKFICDNCKKNFKPTMINGELYQVNGMHYSTNQEPELTGKCYDCGKKTDSYYCDICNQKGLEEMDRMNAQSELEYGHLRNQ